MVPAAATATVKTAELKAELVSKRGLHNVYTTHTIEFVLQSPP